MVIAGQRNQPFTPPLGLDRHPRESGDPCLGGYWIPAFAGMTAA